MEKAPCVRVEKNEKKIITCIAYGEASVEEGAKQIKKYRTNRQTNKNKQKQTKTNLPSEPQVQKPRCIRVKKIK